MASAPIPSAVIFDWDNTLVDSWPMIAPSINYVRKQFGLEEWSLLEIKQRCTRAARESFPEWFGDDWQKASKVYYAHFDKARKESRLAPMPGAESLLRWLKQENIPAFVVSNKIGNYLRLEVDEIGWRDLFGAVVGAQDALRDKPARDPIDLALKSSALTASENVWFVGDSEIDVICARNAGCTPIFLGDSTTGARLSVAQVFSNCTDLQMLFYNHESRTV